MMHRYRLVNALLSPDGEGGGGDPAPTPTPSPAPTPAPAPTPTPTPASGKVELTTEEWTKHQKMLGDYQSLLATERERAEKEEKAKLKALAEHKGFESAYDKLKADKDTQLDAERTKHQSFVKKLGEEKIRSIAAESVAGLKFTGRTPEEQADAAAEFQNIIRQRLYAEMNDSEEFVVREIGTGRQPKDVIAELVAKKSWFFQAETQGGHGGGGSHLSADPNGTYQPSIAPSGRINRAAGAGRYGVGL